MTTRRSLVRSWLILGRLSNLPTIWTNVVAGAMVAGAAADWRLCVVVAAVSGLYTAGMVLNDLCDESHDRAHRSTRPIPSGEVPRLAAMLATAGLVAMSVGAIAWVTIGAQALWWTAALVAAIVYYDVRHKGDVLAPVVMGLCRGLTYGVAASATAGAVSSVVIAGGVLVGVYVAAFTAAARYIPAFRPAVSWAIAGISVIDAAVLLWAGLSGPAALALLAVPVTRLFQRVIPGD